MTDRIKRMYSKINNGKLKICIEKPLLYKESVEKHEGLPMILQRAYATADYLDQRTIYIDEDELIAGNVAAKPNGMEGMVWGPAWPDEDFDEFLKDGLVEISEEDRKQWRECDAFWKDKGRTMNEWQGRFYDSDRMWSFIRSGVLCPPWKDRKQGRGQGGAGFGWGLGIGYSLFIPDYEKIINEGISKTLEDAKEALEAVRYNDKESFIQADYYRAVIIALEAMVRMYHRYGVACEKKAEETASEERKNELLRMADTCHWIADHPSRDFRDAMQNFWFYWMMVAHGTTPLGRFDQFMYPYYKKDLENGTMDHDQALELIECLRIKIMQFNFVSGGKAQRSKWAGMARWHNAVIGGCDPKTGKDATNDISYMVLEAAQEIQTPQFTITIRVGKDTPDELMKKGMELVRTGIGMPAFISEDNYISTVMLEPGMDIETARSFALSGCLDLNIPGKSRIGAIGMFIVPKVLDITMHNGVLTTTGEQLGPKTGEMKDFKTYEDFLNAFKIQLAYFQSMYNEEHNILNSLTRETQCDVVHSAFAYEGISSGRDINDRKMKYENSAVLNPVGMINAANSLAAIKKLVFEEKKFTMEELYSAIEADWEGYEEIQKMCADAPKYGNGIGYVDEIAGELYHFWAESALKLTTIYGVPPKVTGISITAHAPGGAYTCATPDGRHSGETLADGTMSPAQGTDLNGPTAVFRSAMKINQSEFQATLLNMKMHPSAMMTESDLMKMSALVKTYLLNGGKQVQFNVVSNETLRKAQANPKDYKDLVVRVAGYSTYFTILTPAVQEEIIKRSEQKL